MSLRAWWLSPELLLLAAVFAAAVVVAVVRLVGWLRRR